MIGHFVLLAGIDPVQEARLVGLDRAVVSQGKSRYFDKDKVSITNGEILGKTYQRVEIPVLISNQSSSAVTYTWTIERLDLPFADEKTAAETMENVKRRGGKSYLDTLDAEGNPAVVSYGGRELFRQMAVDLTGIDPLTGKPAASEGERVSLTLLDQPIAKPSPLTYREAKSPFPDRWPLAYEVKPVPAEKGKEVVGFPLQSGSFRPFDYFTATLHFNYVGFFDPSKLNIAKDPLTELPMETYRPPSAKWVLDSENRPVNPPKQLKPTDNPLGLLTQPPTMLTTLEAAQALVGDRPISAIRVKVSGVERLDEKSQARLEKIAAEIEKKTGLITDITLGSSPQPILLHVPAVGDLPELGWIEQPWVRIGSAITLFRETQLGYSGIVAGVIAVAAVYVLAMNGMSFLARRKEVAILLAVGLASLPSDAHGSAGSGPVGTAGGDRFHGDVDLRPCPTGNGRPSRSVGGGGMFGHGALPGRRVCYRRDGRPRFPYETMRTGESDPVIRRWIAVSNRWTLAWSYFAGKWRRNLLSVLTIAIPSALFIFFVFVTIRLKGVFYTHVARTISIDAGGAGPLCRRRDRLDDRRADHDGSPVAKCRRTKTGDRPASIPGMAGRIHSLPDAFGGNTLRTDGGNRRGCHLSLLDQWDLWNRAVERSCRIIGLRIDSRRGRSYGSGDSLGNGGPHLSASGIERSLRYRRKSGTLSGNGRRIGRPGMSHRDDGGFDPAVVITAGQGAACGRHPSH